MTEETLHKIQNTELEITDEIFRICEKNNLKCALVGGSCIGAIRHKGIIPWDDDIDLAMPRKDYEKFIDICKRELNSSYFLQCFETEQNCAYIFAKVRKNGTKLPEKYSKHINMHQGIWVDLFVYDNVSNNSLKRKFDNARVFFYKNLLIVKVGFKMPENRSKSLNIIYFLCKLFSNFFSNNFLKNRLNSIMKHYQNKNTLYIKPYGGAYGDTKELMPSNFFNDLITVEFNGRKFKTFKDYDYYLSRLYGDYMTPPPVEKRNGGNHYLADSDIIAD